MTFASSVAFTLMHKPPFVPDFPGEAHFMGRRNRARRVDGAGAKVRAIPLLKQLYSKSQSRVSFLNAVMTAMMCYVFAYNHGDFHEQRSY